MELGVEAVVPLSAKFNRGLDELRTEVLSAITSSEKVSHPFTWMTQSLKDRLLPLQDKQFLSPKFSTAHALRMLSRNISPNGNESQFKSIRKSISNLGFNVNILEATLRYEWIDKIVRSIQPKIEQPIQKISRSEKWDYLLTHQWIGPFIFVGILYLFSNPFLHGQPFPWIGFSLE